VCVWCVCECVCGVCVCVSVCGVYVSVSVCVSECVCVSVSQRDSFAILN